MESVIAGISAFFALVSAGVAGIAVRAASRHSAFEIVRRHYTYLISGEAAEARGQVETYRRAVPAGYDAAKGVLGAYFALLWAFDYVLAGRESLSRMGRAEKPAVTYLDELLRWHVTEWVTRLPQLRAHIQAELGKQDELLSDHRSLDRLCTLAERVADLCEVRVLRRQIEEEDRALEDAGTPCGCALLRVVPAGP